LCNWVVGLLATTVIKADLVDPVVVDDDKVIACGIAWIRAMIAGAVAQLDAKADFLQCGRFKKCVVPLL
jgi:hypothetical protein